MLIGWVLLACVLLLVLWCIAAYNRLVRMQQEIKGAWSQIDVQLKRRHDLIPNLVEAVRGYLSHERQTLENVAKARAQAAGASGVAERAAAENALTQTLVALFAVVERYPDLKASQNMLALQEELTSTENRIAFARQFYNDQAVRLNAAIGSLPTNLVAAGAGFRPAEFFQLEDPAHREAPKVSLL